MVDQIRGPQINRLLEFGDVSEAGYCQQAVQEERDRIRAALKVRCSGITVTGRCALNLGHIGGCYTQADTISITRERLEEILGG